VGEGKLEFVNKKEDEGNCRLEFVSRGLVAQRISSLVKYCLAETRYCLCGGTHDLGGMRPVNRITRKQDVFTNQW
jgi:hypothetical protein